MSAIERQLYDAKRYLMRAQSSLTTIVKSTAPQSVLSKDCDGLATDIALALEAYCHLWKSEKYSDHLPLYRQEKIFARAVLAIPRSTLGQWVGVCGGQLQPLVDALRNELLTHGVLHAGETPVLLLRSRRTCPVESKSRSHTWASQ